MDWSTPSHADDELQQYRLREERSGREFLAHRSRMRKTTIKQLAEDGRRTVLLRPGLPLEDAMDSTVMEEPTQQGDQVKETRDEILNEPRRSVAEQAPEPVTEILNGTESHVRVLDWLEKALPGAAGPEAIIGYLETKGYLCFTHVDMESHSKILSRGDTRHYGR